MDILVSLEVGPTPNLCLRRTDTGVPIEKVVSRQKLRPGSGYLSVRVTTDGPTRVLQINDVQQNKEKTFARTEVPDWLETKRPWLVTNEGRASKTQETKSPNVLQIIAMTDLSVELLRACNFISVILSVEHHDWPGQRFARI